jgi:hypothetical protein
MLITDVTTNKILYNFADPTVTTATVATNIITLGALQGGEANGDSLEIVYDLLPADAAFGDTTEITALTDGTNTANVAATTAAGATSGNSILSAGTGYTTASITLNATNPNSPIFDLLNYASLSITQTAQTGSPTQVSFKASNDSTFTTYQGLILSNSSAGLTSWYYNSAPDTWNGNRTARYFRIMSSFSGSVSATYIITFFTNPMSYDGVNANLPYYDGTSAGSNLAPMGINGDGTWRLVQSIYKTADTNNGIYTPSSSLLNYNGSSFDRQRTPYKFINLNAVVITSETTVWTPASGKKFRIMGYSITTGVLAGAITVKDNTAGSTILIIPQNTIGVVIQSPPMGNGILSAAANNVLTMTGATAETVTGYLFGTEE